MSREGSERVRFDADMILELGRALPAANSPCMPATRRTMCASAATTSSSSQMASAPELLRHSIAAGGPATRRTSAISCKLAQMHNILHMHRRLSGRADRHPPVDPPPRMHPRPRHADRQGVPHLFARQGAQCRRHRDRPHRARHQPRAAARRSPPVFTIINTNSPLKLDMPMMEGIIQMSGAGQVRDRDAVHAVPARWRR